MKNKKSSFFYIFLVIFLSGFYIFVLFNPFLAMATTAEVLPNDPLYIDQWYLQKINALQAWGIKTSSPNVVVAVLDTGVDIDHPDLDGNIWVNVGEIANNGLDDDHNGYIDDLNGWDFVNNTADPKPKFQEGFTEIGLQHGTIVAGIIAARGNNNFGITGINWVAKIMPLKVLSDSGEGNTVSVIKAIDYAINNGADIINLSFVGSGSSNSLTEVILRAYNAGIIVVAAAGNEDTDGTSHSLDVTPAYPVCSEGFYNTVIGVAATDALDQKAYFSNFGQKCIDISAPGTSFAGLSVYDPAQIHGGKIYDTYVQGYWAGTSMSAPVVSGSLALLKSINPKLSNKKVIGVMLQTADNIENLNPTYHNALGAGRINLGQAAQQIYSDLISKKGYIVVAPQSKASSTIKLYGEQTVSFNAYGDNFYGGANLTAGDINGDGLDEIITGAGVGGGPHVRVFDQNYNLLTGFFAYSENFVGGVNVTVVKEVAP